MPEPRPKSDSVATLSVAGLSTGDACEPLSFDVQRGELVLLLCPKAEYAAQLTRQLLGSSSEPGRSCVTFRGRPWSEIGVGERLVLLRGIGVVHGDGGLISNLDLIENVTLPFLSHFPERRSEALPLAERMLATAGYRGRTGQLPEQVNLFSRKQVALARALLMDPGVMIYELLSSGLSQRETRSLLDAALAFHRADAERCSLFITTDEAIERLVPGVRTVPLSMRSEP